MENEKKHHGQLVFGLDIGTRSIVGTVGYKKDDGTFVVVAQCGKEHETRAMLDGQIHDIGKVGSTIKQVKERLEAKLGKKLTKVCIAAAGRVLKTVQIHSDIEYSEEKIVSEEDIYALHSLATEQAYKKFLQSENSDVKFYCVGSSVVRYYLNEYVIGNLQDHKAKKIGVDMIATFLPDDVVDGLYKAVELAGLNVASLTLEPIAAIELAIPEKFRLLNIALVDVGAGTSDISITKEGTIVAFGMIPIAGDSLTEMIANYCLVDFQTAEQIKRDAGEMEIVTYKDIMGLPQTVSSEEINKLLSSSVEKMTDEVANKILELNGQKSVGAVFVVGGGGKISGYTERLAEKLGLVKERVAIRGKEVMGNIVFEDTELEQNSLLVTPIGMCLNFYKENHNFIYVSFNDATVKLYNNDKITVMDAAMQTDFPSTGFFPKSGQELTFTINGKKRLVRGEMGEPALIFVNDEMANLHTTIKENDIIRVQESTAGAAGKAVIEDMPEYKSEIMIVVNGTKVSLPKYPTVNGNIVTGSYEICDGDEIEFLDYVTIDQIKHVMDISVEAGSVCYVNNKEADESTKVYENFEVNWSLTDGTFESLPEDNEDSVNIATELQSENKVETESDVTEGTSSESDEENLALSSEPRDIFVIVNGAPVKLSGKASYVFVDVFNFISFDLSKPQGEIVTTVNGHAAGYMEELHEGDIIEIYWRK